MRNKRVWHLIGVASALAGGLLLAQGLWIPAKATLAQWLLTKAWAEARSANTRPAPWPWADTWPVAKLLAPEHHVAHIVLAQASGRNLAFGPTHVPPSAMPGTPGHVVLSGHRDTHFSFLNYVLPGEIFSLEHPRGLTRYRVDFAEIIDTRVQQLTLEPEMHRLTLVTCYPFDALAPGTPYRYVVHSTAIEDDYARPSSDLSMARRMAAMVAL